MHITECISRYPSLTLRGRKILHALDTVPGDDWTHKLGIHLDSVGIGLVRGGPCLHNIWGMYEQGGQGEEQEANMSLW
jgi:hypothetical protein